MRIEEVHISGFGKWSNVNFELNDGLQVITGSNEAGKSTLASFIVSMLFGFANGHQPYEQYLPKNGAAYGGWIKIKNNDESYQIKRIKGKNGGELTITNELGDQVPNSMLDSMLRNIDSNLYSAIYKFSQQDLNSIFQLTINEFESQLKRVGAVGSQAWIDEINHLNQQADNIYKVRGLKPELNQLLKSYEDNDRQIQNFEDEYDQYEELLISADRLKRDIDDNTNKITSLKSEYDNLLNLKRLWPVYNRLKNLKVNNEDDTKFMGNDDIAEIQALRADITEIDRQISQARAKLADSSFMDQNETNQQFYIDNDQELTDLRENGIRIKMQLDQKSELQRKIRNQQSEKQQLLSRYETNQLPRPLDEQAVIELQKLENDYSDNGEESNSRTSRSRSVTTQSSLIPLIMGVIGILALILGSSWLIKIIGIGIVVLSIWIWKSLNTNKKADIIDDYSNTSQNNKRELVIFGQKYGLGGFKSSMWLRMQGDLHRGQELDRQISQDAAKLRKINLKINQFEQSASFAQAAIGPYKSTEQLINKINLLIDSQKKFINDRQRQQQRKHVLEDQIEQLNQRIQEVSTKKQSIYTRFNLSNDHDFDLYYDNFLKSTVAQERSSALSDQVDANQVQELDQFLNEESLNKSVDKLKNDINETETKKESDRQKMVRNRVKADQMAQNGSLTKLRQQQANLQEQINDLTEKWLTTRLTANWIDRALQLATSDRFPQIISQAKKYFSFLTDGHYDDIKLEDDIIRVVSNDSTSFDVGELSQGTAEQLYVSLRLGFAFVMSHEVNLPIIIDDGFVNFDQKRRDAVLTLLDTLSRNNQILYFTSSKSVKDKVGSRIINLDEMQVNR